MHSRFLLPALLLTVLTPVPASPQRQAAGPMMAAVDSDFFRGLEFRLVGPSRGGRVTTVTGVPSQPRTFYMGVASGGLFRTTDGGESWVPISDGKIPVGSMGSIAVADSDPNVIWVGTGSDGVRSNVSTGRGVYRSTDGGENWSFAGLYDAGQIGAIRVHPTNPEIAWVAAYGDIFKKNLERGVFKTTDGGRTWRKTLFVADSVGAMDVELHPANPDVVYAWMNRIERKPWTIISGSRVGGFYKSTDGGERWTRIMTGLPGELIGKANLAVTAAQPDRIYALVEALPGGGMYRSDDAGRTWTQTSAQSSLVQRPFYYTTLGADPTNADVVYAGAEGFFKSTDGGRTFSSMRTPHGDNHDIWVNPNDGNIMIQSNDGGANVSFDGGRTWSTQGNQPTSEIYGVWLDDRFPYQLYGAQQDNSTIIISSTATGGIQGEDWSSGPGCETGPIMPHPSRRNIVYGACKGQFGVENLETGQQKNYWIGAQSLYGNPASDLIYRFQRVAPMETSTHDPDVVYYGSQYVHRSRDLGVNWETLSPDLTANPECCQGASGEPITRDVTGEEFYSTLYSIRESVLEPGVIWTGSNDGPFHVTRDDGKTWTDITPKDLQPGGRVQFIEPSPHRPGSAYYATHRFLLGDYHPYIYRTDDYGKTWTLLTDGSNGIPEDWPTRVVREDPDREGLLYAGTEFGMFISFDNGAHWQPFDLNMPNVPIADIKVHRQDLVVATQGRAFWILDNVSSLHQITPEMATERVHLYRPRAGYRTQEAPGLLGPTIEYYLPSEPAGPVSIDILDAGGALIRTYSSDQPAAGGGGRRGGNFDPEMAMMFGRTQQPGVSPGQVTRSAGLNRFVWDLRYPGAMSAAGRPAGNGPTAPPGPYQARLNVGSSTLTTSFEVLIDPRIAEEGTTVEDLREQFDHNMRMRDLVGELNVVVDRVRQAQARLQNATGAAADTARRVQAIADRLFTPTIRYSKPGLQSHINYLNGMTGRVDQKPGRDALERYTVLRREFDALRADLDRTLGTGG